jgi:hypothetical protein
LHVQERIKLDITMEVNVRLDTPVPSVLLNKLMAVEELSTNVVSYIAGIKKKLTHARVVSTHVTISAKWMRSANPVNLNRRTKGCHRK